MFTHLSIVRIRRLPLILITSFFVHVSILAASAPDTLRATIDRAIDKVRPALVRIHVVSVYYSEGREIRTQAIGSGAIIREDGHLITNHHVAGHASRIFCTLSSREEMEAELVGTDALTDISILKLQPTEPRTFPVAAFGDSTRLQVGDHVLAMGSPMALSQSVTLGIVSNMEMMMPKLFGPYARLTQDGEDVGSLVKWIGHDAAIYGGNSGGPLVNLDGEIVGINEISMGLGGAIPGNLARDVADQLILHGKVPRAWMGIGFQPLLKYSGHKEGVLVSSVLSDSPAAQAGFQPGDILLRVNDRAISVRTDESMPDFMRFITDLPIDKTVRMTRLRHGEKERVSVTPIEREDIRLPQREIKVWGVTARNLSLINAREQRRQSRDGVQVMTVRPGGPAGDARPGLRPLDIILSVDGMATDNLETLLSVTQELMEGAGESEKVPVMVEFERQDARHLTVVKLGIDELRDPGLEVTRAWLPVETQVISREIARQLGRPELRGFRITKVHDQSTAAAAGLKTGDFILAIDGERLEAREPEDYEELAALVRQYDVGASVELTILRDNRTRPFSVELQRSPRLQREMKKYFDEEFEFLVRNLAFEDRDNKKLAENDSGVLVEEIKPGSWAELGDLYSGDVIQQIDGQPVNNVEQVREIFNSISETKPEHVTLRVLRGIYTVFLELETDWTE